MDGVGELRNYILRAAASPLAQQLQDALFAELIVLRVFGIETNRAITHKYWEVVMHYLGKPMTKEEAEKLPMMLSEDANEVETLDTIKKINTIPCYALAEKGFQTVRFVKGNHNEWVTGGYYPSDWDTPVEPNWYFENKFLTEEQMQTYKNVTLSLLLGMVSFESAVMECSKASNQ